MHVVEAFQITGRGVAVFLATEADVTARQTLRAVIIHPNGTSLSTGASKEWARQAGGIERVAFLLRDLSLVQVPLGSEVILTR